MTAFVLMPAYYLVRSREELKRELGDQGQSSHAIPRGTRAFVEPSIWTTPRSMYTSDWSPQQADSLKLTFLADLCSAIDMPEWLTDCLESDRPRAERLRALLALRPHSTQTFDQWWTLEYLGVCCERSETAVFNELPMNNLLEIVTSKGSRADEFWQFQISKRREVPERLLAGFRWLLSWVRKELAPRTMFISTPLAEYTEHLMALAVAGLVLRRFADLHDSVGVETWLPGEKKWEAGDVMINLMTCEWHLGGELNLTWSVSRIHVRQGSGRRVPRHVAEVTMEVDSTITVIRAVVTRSEHVL